MNQDYKPSAGEHPITPPPELVQRLSNSPDNWLHQITNAYQAGADMELEACCLLLDDGEHAASYGCHDGTSLRNARRPKPPSLKEQALKALTAINSNFHVHEPDADIIRRALEQLND